MERWNGPDSRLSQIEANKLLEGIPLDMAQRYANIMLLFQMTIFYLPLIPYVPFITCLGILFQYWCVKIMLIRVHGTPKQLGATLAYFFSNSIPYFMILFGVSNYFWHAVLWKENEVGVVSLFTVVIYLILPIRVLLDRVSMPPNTSH